MRGVNGLAACRTLSRYGGDSLRDKRVQEPEGKRMIAASIAVLDRGGRAALINDEGAEVRTGLEKSDRPGS